MNPIDRNAAILWARAVFANPTKYYILDTETTGLHNPEIIELAVIDLDETMIINQRFKPKTEIEPRASQIHGIINQVLADKPEWGIIADRFEQIIADRTLLVYNLDFDSEAIFHTYSVHDLLSPSITGECVMQWYSQFVGNWNEYRQSYKWQKLTGGDHSAIGDCLATLKVIKQMAATNLELPLDEISTTAQPIVIKPIDYAAMPINTQ
jgi:DNA polymerase III subunit epsilon